MLIFGNDLLPGKYLTTSNDEKLAIRTDDTSKTTMTPNNLQMTISLLLFSVVTAMENIYGFRNKSVEAPRQVVIKETISYNKRIDQSN